MSNADVVFAGRIPELYDSCLAPLIFEPYAADLADRIASVSPMSLLETAAGTGVVARALIGRLRPGARYVITDLNQAMLDHAVSRQAPDRRMEWGRADALDLPFGDGSFDVVACQFGAMFFPDRAAGHAEARRVLKAGGRYVWSVWDRIENNPFTQVVEHAVAAIFPDDPPRFPSRTPHGYFDLDRIRADAARAGFADIVIETVQKRCAASSARHVAVAFCHGTPLRNEVEKRDPNGLGRATDVATAALEERYGKRAIVAGMQALVVTAIKG